MADEIKDISTRMVEVMSTPGFSSLSKKDQSELINQVTSSYHEDTGWFGKIFGNRQSNVVIYITLVICVLLLLIGIITMCCFRGFCSEYWSGAFPIISGALCYMYGRSNKKE